MDGRRHQRAYYPLLGMYEGDPYGEEIEQGDDKNDGLNALVRKEIF